MNILRTAASVMEERSSEIRSLLNGLRLSGQTRDIQAGKKYHLAAIQTGHDTDIHVSTALVDMYSRCGRLPDARKIFDTLPHPPHLVLTWNAMISGYAQTGHPSSALTLFTYMHLHGCVPDSRTFVAALSACVSMIEQAEVARLRSLEKGMQIHTLAAEDNLESDRYVATALVNMYSESGSLFDARSAFDKIEFHDTASWNALILGCVKNGEGSLALELFRCMITGKAGCQPDERTFVVSLKACSSLCERESWEKVDGGLVKPRSLATGMFIHQEAAGRYGRLSDYNFLSNTLVDMYSKCGSISDARRVFDEIASPDVISWTAMISGYSDNGEEERALELFADMQRQAAVAPNRATYVAVLGACSHLAGREPATEVDENLVKLKSLQTGMSIHSQLRSSCEEELFVASSLVEMYSKSGSLADARRVFDRMRAHDVVSWTSLISAYALNGEADLALELFTAMQRQRCQPDSRSFVAAVLACTGGKDRASVVSKLRELEHRALEEGYADLKRETFVANTLTDAYSKCASLEDARRVFERLELRDVVSWTVIILGHAQNGEAECGLELFLRMITDGACRPDGPVYAAALVACRLLSRLQTGRRIHTEIYRYGLESNGALVACLVHFYGRCGEVLTAQQAFDSVGDGKQTAAWNGLVAGYSFQGNVEKVLETVSRMEECSVAPDEATFVSVLSACSHAGLVEKGKEVFARMKSEYGVTPNARHYACVVDLLSRSNHLEEAVEMVRRIPDGGEGRERVLPWLTVLGACQEWLDVEVGEIAFKSVIQVDQRKPAAYDLISNIYKRKT